MAVLRETAYARELARAVLEYPGGEVRIFYRTLFQGIVE
jgi:hypothetical protein